MNIKNVIIVGGGTAGWISAHNVLNRTSPDVKVTVIATEEIPIIGVGESTTGRMNDLICRTGNLTGLNEEEFLKKSESTFKLGIVHSDWHTVGQSFFSPIGDDIDNETGYPCSDYDYMRIFHVAHNFPYEYTFQSQCMKQNKIHFDKNYQNIYEKNNIRHHPVAYHLDTYKAGQYLKDKAVADDRCTYIDDQVVDFEQDENGFVKNVKTKSGQVIEGELFIDCTGFKRLLISKVEDNPFITYKDNLLVNRALAFHTPYEENEPIKTYTHAWAQKYGWLWQIPTQKRMGCGYVFNDTMTTPEDALKEIETLLNKKIEVQKDIKFEAGRLTKLWTKNVISTGLASAFVEPLEATSIHATLMQITHFFENYYKKDMPFNVEEIQDQYNREMCEMWDLIRDFITFHYKTPRTDTEFWIESNKKERQSERLKRVLAMWKVRMPRRVDYLSDKNNNFYNLGNALWYQIALGMKALDPEIAKQELIDYGLYNLSKERYQYLVDNTLTLVSDMISTNDYYKWIQNK